MQNYQRIIFLFSIVTDDSFVMIDKMMVSHSKLQFREANLQDVDRIWEIILQAKAQMFREKKQQWDENYPLPDHITADIEKGFGYVLTQDEVIIAYGAVVFDGEPAYNELEGEWLSGQPYVVVHRLAVANEAKRHGIATQFIQNVINLSVGKGIMSFKVDTNFDNFYMLNIFEKMGFTYCGKILYAQGERMAFEKLLGK